MLTGGTKSTPTPTPTPKPADPVTKLLSVPAAKIECAKTYNAVTQATQFLACVAKLS